MPTDNNKNDDFDLNAFSEGDSDFANLFDEPEIRQKPPEKRSAPIPKEKPAIELPRPVIKKNKDISFAAAQS